MESVIILNLLKVNNNFNIMTFNFDNTKKCILEKDDKSSIGEVDKPIKDLCDKINSNKDYFTTSSCSGRIALIIEDGRKAPNLILFRTHKLTNFNELKKEIKKASENKESTIYLKQEPCLVVVSSRNKEKQMKLLSEARNNGWKKSGILSIDRKLLIELMSTEVISFPVINRGEILIGDELLNMFVGRANDNLNKGWKKIDNLKDFID